VETVKDHRLKVLKHHNRSKLYRKPVINSDNGKESEENKKLIDENVINLEDQSDDAIKVNHKPKNSHHYLFSDVKKVHSNGEKRAKKIKRKPILIKEDE
jgi:hypothetical protein